MYDPTHSVSFNSATKAAPYNADGHADDSYWGNVLSAATLLMDDDIREEVHADKAPCPPLDFLLAYMERHYTAYHSHFNWC